MDTERIKGIISPVITPMGPDEAVDLNELRRQIDRQINAGVHGIFFFGTNGEGYILSRQEKETVLAAAIEQVNRRVPVYAGTGCVGTKETISLSLAAKSMGADVLSVICPYFAAVSQDEIYEHYKTVAETVRMPVVVYNIPARAGVNIAPATIERLSRVDYVVGVKDSSGNFDNMLRYIECTRDRGFAVLSGNDSLILWNLQAGGAGAISGIANIFPHTMVSLYETFLTGDFQKARQIQDSIRPIRDCFAFGNPNTIVKRAVELLGYPVGGCRAPFNRLSQEGDEAIINALNAAKEKRLN